MALKARFESRDDLIDALDRQRIVPDREVASTLAEEGELVEFAPGRTIIEQGGEDRHLYFLLAGKAQIVVNQVRLYARDKGVTVGEMSAITPDISRAATVEASETTVAWKISHQRLAEVGERHPSLWRRIAQDLAERLEQRNQFVNRVNARPRIFLICSAEALAIGRAIRIGLDHDAEVVIWSDDKIFAPGAYPLEALEDQVGRSDFGIALAEPDDLVLSRDRLSATPRDNVIFELGFFMSRLGRHRTLLLVPQAEDVKLPSDFKGLTPLPYRSAATPRDLPVALGPVIDRISGLIADLGVRSSLMENK
ncbi:TIR domain-containing protein [uncultured Brevundimonas sp.]|uniref:TIR domain-containing protein n=1 Tax=uncultured Brevundimonas sp. TaxID=213418 RepID=UPI0025FA9F1E|nr:TIR domain-containing protein [uncultured Brevundimonas sp.]